MWTCMLKSNPYQVMMPEHFLFFSISFPPFCTKNVWCVGCSQIKKIKVWKPNPNRLLPKLRIAYHHHFRLRVVPHYSSGTVERAKRARENHPTREKETRGVSPFLAWGHFHARSRFARSTIPEEKWGTTRSLSSFAKTEQISRIASERCVLCTRCVSGHQSHTLFHIFLDALKLFQGSDYNTICVGYGKNEEYFMQVSRSLK